MLKQKLRHSESAIRQLPSMSELVVIAIWLELQISGAAYVCCWLFVSLIHCHSSSFWKATPGKLFLSSAFPQNFRVPRFYSEDSGRLLAP
jgi:hypothetical protein